MFEDDLWAAQKISASGLAKRFAAVAENLANINTPGYARKEVFFEEELREAIRKQNGADRLKVAVTQENHIGQELPGSSSDEVQIVTQIVDDEPYRLDGNNVDPEIEMAELAKTRMAYNTVLRLMAKRADMIKASMGGK
ncbi:MAG: flagellar basal body rod protein FlgB [Thermovirga sp.]